MCAAWRGEEGEITGAALSAADPAGLTPLHVAAMRGKTGSGKAIIDAEPEAINVPDLLGRTPLIHAATGGSAEMVGLLLSRGAKLEWTSSDGKTALHWAVIAHRSAAVEALVNAGAETQVRDSPPEERLLRPNMKEHDDGKTPHDYASERMGKDPVYKFLADYLKKVDEVRVAEGPTARVDMPEMPWVTHAHATLAAQKQADAAAEASHVAPTAVQPASDIFDEADAELFSTGDDGGDSSQNTTAATLEPASSEAAPAAGAEQSAADLDELD